MASEQYGVVSVWQLLDELGYSHSAVERAVAAGVLHRLHRGVYAVGHTDLSLHGRCLAAVLGCGPGASVSHWSAAWLWGILATRPVPIHVTTPIPRPRRTGLLIHRSRTLIDEDLAARDGIPVTSVPRTALDLAHRVRRASLDRLLQSSEELRLFDLAAFESILERNRGHRGVRPLRLALSIYRVPPFTRSGLERRFLALVEAAGLPRPAMNFNFAGFEPDAFWPEARFAVELDVYETHGGTLAFERDRLRDEELMLADVLVDRVTGERLDREPDRVMGRVAALLARRRRELGV